MLVPVVDEQGTFGTVPITWICVVLKDMTTDTAHVGFGPAFHPLENCLECGSEDVATISDIDQIDFLCRRCGHRWHVGFGHVWQVDPPDGELVTPRSNPRISFG
jgi:hypothetical protein